MTKQLSMGGDWRPQTRSGVISPKDVASMCLQFYDDAGHVTTTSNQDDRGQYVTKALKALHQLKTNGFWCVRNKIHKEQTHAARV
jgi:hypothetical protein